VNRKEEKLERLLPGFRPRIRPLVSSTLMLMCTLTKKRGMSRGLQRDVVYLGLTNSALVPSYVSPNAGGGGGLRGSQPMITAVHRSPNKLRRFNSIFKL
jgi:hypothetical protein